VRSGAWVRDSGGGKRTAPSPPQPLRRATTPGYTDYTGYTGYTGLHLALIEPAIYTPRRKQVLTQVRRVRIGEEITA
jgi:hypothetical protein